MAMHGLVHRRRTTTFDGERCWCALEGTKVAGAVVVEGSASRSDDGRGEQWTTTEGVGGWWMRMLQRKSGGEAGGRRVEEGAQMLGGVL